MKFDKYEGILPRSMFEFYTSPDGEIWDQVGFIEQKEKLSILFLIIHILKLVDIRMDNRLVTHSLMQK